MRQYSRNELSEKSGAVHTLRSKTRVAQTNELLLKVIVYNIVMLVHSMFELGIETPTFPCTQRLVAAHKLSH